MFMLINFLRFKKIKYNSSLLISIEKKRLELEKLYILIRSLFFHELFKLYSKYEAQN